MYFKTTTAFLALLSVANASPTTGKRQPVQAGHIELLSRQLTQKNFRDSIPGCGDDPSYVENKSTYGIGDGKKLPKDGKDDACTTGHDGSHCWTEYYFVENEIEYSDWQNSGSAIDCNSTSSCSSADFDLGQTCDTHTISHSDGGEWKILDLAVDGKVADKYGLKAGGSMSYKWDNTESDSATVCATAGSRNTCTWEDDECHQLWFAQRNLRVYGYAMRVCVGEGSGKTQMNEQKDGGRWVRGMADFSISLPINKVVACNALCDEPSYDEPKPSTAEEGESGRYSFEADW